MAHRYITATLLSLALAGCSFDTDKLSRPCSAQAPCPAGQACVAGRCQQGDAGALDRATTEGPIEKDTGPQKDGPAKKDGPAPDGPVKPKDMPQPDAPKGKPCSKAAQCNDNASCTTDSCAKGVCVNALQTGFCLINKVCRVDGAAEPGFDCSLCQPKVSASTWTKVPCVSTLSGMAGTHGKQDGPAKTATFYMPAGVALDGAGDLWVADNMNHALRKISKGQVSTEKNQSGGWHPQGLIYSGKLYVAGWTSQKVSTFSGGILTNVAGSSKGFMDKVPPGSAKFDSPMDVALGAGGKVYVLDSRNHRVRLVYNNKVTTVAGSGPIGWQNGGFADGGAITAARFHEPGGLAVDAKGDLYVADSYNHCIRKVSGGQVTTFAGAGKQWGLTDGPLKTARFKFPADVVVVGGDLYVADTNNHAIRRISGGQVTTVAGGKMGTKDGPGPSAEFNKPYSVAVQGKKIYVADRDNHLIRLVTLP